MATLQQLGVTFSVGLGVLTVTLVLFAGALRLRITHIAPRCEARPRNVIYNPTAGHQTSSSDRHVQHRGNPLFGWIFWLLQLSYHTLIEGVPGTGTRRDGLAGHFLALNLDSIVLLRFHALGLRVTSFCFFVYCGVALPIYFSARCFDAPFDADTGVVENCTLDASYNLTRYERLTLANVPPLDQAHVWGASNIHFRLYMIVICTYIVTWYTSYELQKEWVDLLAMRRVYYLEKDHWKGRREELKATMLVDDHDDDDSHHHHNRNSYISRRRLSRNKNLLQDEEEDDAHLHRREAWIPHPEQRDTPPNIGLYSVLVAGVPKRPRQVVSSEKDLEAANSTEHEQQQDITDSTKKQQKLDWQLSVTSAFFDYCVPNQPGFSSSVAAVTILPSAVELAAAWKKWYRAIKKLQRLRFIRRQLLERGLLLDEDDDNNDKIMANQQQQQQPPQQPRNSFDSEDLSINGKGSGARGVQHAHHKKSKEFDGIYMRSSSRRNEYTQAILGDVTDDDVEAMFLKSLHMGPEQTAVYSLELAKGSSKCCPRGLCCEERIRFTTTEDLVRMEAEAVEDAHASFLELEVVRKKVALAQEGRGEDGVNCHNKRQSVFADLGKLAIPGCPSDELTKADASIETRLYGQGQAALESSSSLQRKPSRGKSIRKASFATSLNRIKGGETETSPSSLSGSTNARLYPSDKPAANGRGSELLRPRLDTEGSTYFPIGPDVSRPRLDTEGSAYFPSMIGTVSSADRQYTASQGSSSEALHPWQAVKHVATECEQSARTRPHASLEHRVSDGIWHRPSLRLIWGDFWKQSCGMIAWTLKASEEATDLLARDSTFAVVTFTSRQAAIAARKCLADGRGSGKWITIDEVPVPPLADAAAFNICDCRGCCRPVTVTLNDHQKIMRNYIALAMVAVIYVFYTFPITFAATYGSEQFTEAFPSLQVDKKALYGFIQAQLLNLFLALCPHMFLFIANFGSNATSMVEAEFAALQYYWWFFVLFALLGSSIAQMVLQTFREGSFRFQDTLQRVAATIPVQVSSTWCNWIILKALILHPLFYLLQLHSFILSCLQLKCCLRLVRGGGVGNRIPYRWFVESGMVLLFALALAPAAPIISPFALLYFIICNPILRHVLIFTYKPQYDAGGIRWPFLFEMCISSLLVSQILLGTMLALKKAVGPAAMASVLVVPTLVFRRTVRKRFLVAYHDAALLQTSLLDGWDTTAEDSATRTQTGREEFRQFLVDAHKAAYVPVCVAGTNTDKILTAEPAVVIASTTDTDFVGFSSASLPPIVGKSAFAREVSGQSVDPDPKESFRRSQQAGAVMRRNCMTLFAGTLSQTQQQTDNSLPSVVAGRNVSSNSADGVDSIPPVKISSLGLIREAENGEKMYMFDDEIEAQKDR